MTAPSGRLVGWQLGAGLFLWASLLGFAVINIAISVNGIAVLNGIVAAGGTPAAYQLDATNDLLGHAVWRSLAAAVVALIMEKPWRTP